jgi:hypothetical protein
MRRLVLVRLGRGPLQRRLQVRQLLALGCQRHLPENGSILRQPDELLCVPSGGCVRMEREQAVVRARRPHRCKSLRSPPA